MKAHHLLLSTGLACLLAASLHTALPAAAETFEMESAIITVAQTDVASATTTVDIPVNTPYTWNLTETGSWVYYGEDGTAVTGIVIVDGQPYVFESDGTLCTSWQTVDGIRRYYDPVTSEIRTGWILYQDRYYYADLENGKYTGMQYGLPALDGSTTTSSDMFLLDSYGALQVGFATDENGYHYYGDHTTGILVTGDIKIDGIWYSFASNGREKTGWQTISGNTYYFDPESGESQIGLVTIDSKTYYITADDGLQTGWQTISGKKYYFNTDGVMQTGWQTISSKKYYFDSDGIMQTGFITVSDKQYYLNDNGVMQTGWQTISGKKYYFNTNGVMQTGLQTISGKKYYFKSSGVLLTNSSVVISGVEYEADANGILSEAFDGTTSVMGTATATVEQMQAYLLSVNPNVSQSVLDMIPYYLSEGEAEGVRGDIAFAQSLLETGNFTFSGSAVSLSQNNFCGLGVTSNGTKGCSFSTAQLGIRAQIQHLKAYASTDDLNQDCVDPRFCYVRRGCAEYVEWLGIQENPNGYGWASGANYGDKILTILKKILAM